MIRLNHYNTLPSNPIPIPSKSKPSPLKISSDPIPISTPSDVPPTPTSSPQPNKRGRKSKITASDTSALISGTP